MNPLMAFTASLFIIAFILLALHPTDASVGVCYGRNGDNLPCAEDVVNLYESNAIGYMRLYDPDQATLQALQDTQIKVMLGVPNEEIPCIGSDQSTADNWVQTNVVPYAPSIKYIAVGNEIQPSDQLASSVEPAMQNILNALCSNYLENQIKVSTAIDTGLLKISYPPSMGEFKNLSYITPIVNFLTTNDSPMLVNFEPYVAYVSDFRIGLEYALFTKCETTFTDSGKNYTNLFDAMYDATYVALGKVVTPPTKSLNYDDYKKQGKDVKIVASESGWPSESGFPGKGKNNVRKTVIDRVSMAQTERRDQAATVDNARTYYTNLINHVKKGTPLTPGQEIETYLFAMFDENKKTGDKSERYYGLFTTDEKPKYGQLNF